MVAHAEPSPMAVVPPPLLALPQWATGGGGADGGWRCAPPAPAYKAFSGRRTLTLARLSWEAPPNGSSGDVALTLDNLVERAERRKRGECAAAGTALLCAALCDDGASGGGGHAALRHARRFSLASGSASCVHLA